jgi:SAM-dependent methyltransferase
MTRDVPRVGAVAFGDLRRTSPIVRRWGLERGRPIDRFYIEGFLEANAAAIRGHVLEVGGDAYTREFGGDHVHESVIVDVAADNPNASIVADLSNAPQIASNSFDCVICTQMLQYAYEIAATVRTLHRILKPGGVVLATLPGISQADDLPSDGTRYWNFTAQSARRLFGDAFGAANVDVAAHGNVLAATCFLHGLVVEELRVEELAHADPAFPLLITVRAVKGLAGMPA